MKRYKRLTTTQVVNGRNIKTITSKGKVTIQDLIDRLYELEDKIENGNLVFIDEPFWSEYHDCWAVFQRTEDIVQTCYMTVNQAKDYKAEKRLEEMKNGNNDRLSK